MSTPYRPCPVPPKLAHELFEDFLVTDMDLIQLCGLHGITFDQLVEWFDCTPCQRYLTDYNRINAARRMAKLGHAAATAIDALDRLAKRDAERLPRQDRLAFEAVRKAAAQLLRAAPNHNSGARRDDQQDRKTNPDRVADQHSPTGVPDRTADQQSPTGVPGRTAAHQNGLPDSARGRHGGTTMPARADKAERSSTGSPSDAPQASRATTTRAATPATPAKPSPVARLLAAAGSLNATGRASAMSYPGTHTAMNVQRGLKYEPFSTYLGITESGADALTQLV